MGIPFYFASIVNTYPGIVKGIPPQTCDYLFLDFNGAIHPAARAVLDEWEKAERIEEAQTEEGRERIEDEICKSIWNYLLNLVERAKPTKAIQICMDGVAPRAKIMQQRKRRYLTKLRYELENKTQIWDTNAISPGTMFMTKLHAYLRNRIREHTWIAPVSFSDSTVAGEGEHKIFEMLDRVNDVDPVVQIYGLDADLIMLTLLSHRSNIFLMREDTMSKSEEKSFIYLDVTALRIGIVNQLATQHGWLTEDEAINPFSKKVLEVIESYVTMCFLLGNDFIPNVPSLSLKKRGIDHLMKAYSQMYQTKGLHLVGYNDSDEIAIRIECLELLMEQVSNTEADVFWQINKDYLMKKPNDADSIEFYPIVNKHPLAKEIYNTSTASWQSLYYKHLFNAKVTETEIISKACEEYLKGVMWTYQYYKRRPKDATWYYQYNYAPTSADLANHLFANSKSIEAWVNAKYPRTVTTDSILQLICILPKSSISLVPRHAQKIITDDNLGCAYMFPDKYTIITYLKTHLWECHPVLPALDFKLLQQALQDM